MTVDWLAPKSVSVSVSCESCSRRFELDVLQVGSKGVDGILSRGLEWVLEGLIVEERERERVGIELEVGVVEQRR